MPEFFLGWVVQGAAIGGASSTRKSGRSSVISMNLSMGTL